jgi:hypothetical protein
VKRHVQIVLTAVFVSLASCGRDPVDTPDELELSYDFQSGSNGWTAHFADYPQGSETFYELLAEHRALPAPLEARGRGMFLFGNNHSDDLFMYLTKSVTGLQPNSTYRMRFSVEIATNAGRDCAGAGGSPSLVPVKVGATASEPTRVLVPGSGAAQYYRMGIDKGEQSSGGRDAFVIGTVAGTSTNCSGDAPYALKRLDSAGSTFDLTTGASGSLWLIVGFDSGFEGRQGIYVTEVEARLERKYSLAEGT